MIIIPQGIERINHLFIKKEVKSERRPSSPCLKAGASGLADSMSTVILKRHNSMPAVILLSIYLALIIARREGYFI